jgi:uncharacterized SAM-binding protein YcdF (DUF218 family)
VDASEELVDALNNVALFLAYDDWTGERVDAAVLLGNSVLETARYAAEAINFDCARYLMIAGGHGHQTGKLRSRIEASPYGVRTAGRAESEMLAQIVKLLGVPGPRVLVEDRSTNTGENAAFALRVFTEHGLIPESIVILQDPTMLRRSHATFKHVWRDWPTRIFGHSVFIPEAKAVDGQLSIGPAGAQGIWSPQEFVSLVLGEIPRLRDDESGYGPNGAGYIEHVEIPYAIEEAYGIVAGAWPEFVRPR